MKEFLGFAMAAMLATTVSAQVTYPFQNPSLSNEERVENLLSLLTPEEGRTDDEQIAVC